MAEARDRALPLHVATTFPRRRTSFIYLDPLPTPAPRNPIARPRARNSHSLGMENTPLVTPGRGRGRGFVLPSWYPRTPLRDITILYRAIERSRARLGENEGQQIGDSDQVLLDPFSASQIERDSSQVEKGFREELQKLKRTPSAKKGEREKRNTIGEELRSQIGDSDQVLPDPFSASQIEHDSSQVEKGFGEELHKLKRTPSAKKVLPDPPDPFSASQIERDSSEVEKGFREELQKLESTPSAKKAEREKRVRTSMSMR
ncbi:protein POLYCHOME-like [Abrus precatorius]|uniref:Protein POLYCHOME-like n=1 Tax=Abrus precatorius TaxID=3816 RepID=A0A8B8L8M1_ABRPR|nr:protein POLYCHOME-like [Abrus precatorius]